MIYVPSFMYLSIGTFKQRFILSIDTFIYMYHLFRHYMIPFNVAERGHLQVKGTKLHVYMDHIFTAKRVKG